MMQDRDQIVVFFQFDSAIDANLAKSKLDAYGVPCFLTEENMASLYQQALAIKVRLHIFEKDREEATRVLFQEQIKASDEIHCPVCESTSVERDFPRALSNEFAGALKLIFFGVFMPGKKIFRCRHCNYEF